jgi:hypothetical protein
MTIQLQRTRKFRLNSNLSYQARVEMAAAG